jgi:hypothetical protein
MRRAFDILRLFLIVTLALAFGSSLCSGQTVVQDRIHQVIGSSGSTALSGSVHPLARTEFDQGSVDGSLQLHGMSIDFKRSAAQQAALETLLQAQWNPSSPSYRQWLTPATFAAQFGMSQGDLGSVTAWLRSQGFTIDRIADSGNSIRFSGTAAQAQQAFQTQIHKYSVHGELHYANTSDVVLPSALASVVDRVGGLHDFRPKPRLVRPATARSTATHAQFTSGVSGSHFVAPGDFATIYDVNTLYSAGITGAGQTIGVAGQSDIVMADITSFRSAAGLPANNPTVFLIPGSADPGVADVSGDVNEADLDLEWSGGVAKAANIVYINSTDALTSLEYAIQNQVNGMVIPILSNSYGDCEPNYTTADLHTMEAAFQQANAQGQTVLGPAGDNGAADCDYTPSYAQYAVTSATHGLQVDYPASSVYVTALGGSEFMGDGTAANPATGADQYWNATGSTDLLTSAISYIPEMAWNDTTYDISLGEGLAGGGGGASLLWAKPSWQTGVPGIPADGKRDVPDISLSASADHDAYLVCTQTTTANPNKATYVSSCNNGFRLADIGYNDDQSVDAFGGTSVAVPSFAGILALIEQKVGASHGLGNINPNLYTLASNASTYSSAFHDITSGNNLEPCTAGTTNCPSSGQLGYAAGTGYDQATGLGSVDAAKLAAAFGTVVTQVGTSTAVSSSPASPVVGATVTLTATVTQASGSTAPTGTVTFTIDGTVGSTITIQSNVATTATTFSTGGTHTVVASYSGDANYFASTSAADTITVAVPVTAATTTTSLPAGLTVSLGSSITLTATVQSATAGTLAGTVTFTNGSATLGSAPINPGASGTGTATLSVSSATPALGFTAGTDTITASYSGSSSYAASSGTAPVTVTNPGISMVIPNMTIPSASAGASGTSTITLTSTGGYAGTVNLTATAQSLAAAYSLGSTSLALTSNGTAATTITITTVSQALRGRMPPRPGREREEAISLAGVGVGALLLFGLRRRRRNWVTLSLCVLTLSSLGALVGCGGSSTSAGAAATGSYAVTVTATDTSNSAITTSTTFNVTIQ